MKRAFFDQRVFAFSFICAMAMVAVEVSPLVSAFSFVLLVWKWGVERLQWKKIPKIISNILSVLLLIQVLFQFRTLVGQEPAYTFLLGLAGLRVMDYSTERDHRFVVLLGFVLVSIKALFSLDIYWILPSAISFFGLWYALLPAQIPDKARLLLKMFFLAFPLAALLFFAFPRFILPWSMSRGESSGQIGFSDELNPGGVSRLAATTEIAFRAKLSSLGAMSTPDLYWRGSVLSISRGLSWIPARSELNRPLADREIEKLPTYDVALEPHGRTFLFALDGSRYIQLESGKALHFKNDIFRTVRPIMGTMAYRVAWDSKWIDRTQPDIEDLQVPKLKGQTQKWISDNKEAHKSTSERVKALQDFFSDSRFRYTLSPGSYAPNDLDAFLFERRRGFCEHFAGAYATLARALDIPARVVIGYHGGIYNRYGDFWRVAQKDAHAWVEIFVDKEWKRIDPTSWVAPLRLSIGAEDFFALSENEQREFAKISNWRAGKKSDEDLIGDFRFWMEDMNYRWSYFLIDFDRSSQKNLLEEILDHRTQFLLGLFAFVLVGVLIFRSLFNRKAKMTAEQVLIEGLESWGQERGYLRRSDQTPLDYIHELLRAFPHQKEGLNEAFEYFDMKSYAQKDLKKDPKQILKRIRYRDGEER